jgi:hypothetical protein
MALTEDQIVDAATNWLRREFGAGYFCGECTVVGGGRADLVYEQRADVIHVVEAKSRAEDWPTGFRQLARYPANYKWLAIAEDEYRDSGGGIATAASGKGYGLLLISGGPHHRVVKVRRAPVYRAGRFDDKWNF